MLLRNQNDSLKIHYIYAYNLIYLKTVADIFSTNKIRNLTFLDFCSELSHVLANRNLFINY